MDNRQALLAKNESKRLNLRLPLLVCFALFSAWQMGMVFFSGKTLSVDGRTPLPVTVGNLDILIAAGYILSILVMIFLPRIIVWAERITAIIALLSVLALYLPARPEILAAALYSQFFCCCFMIGFETAVIVGLFTERTVVLHLTAAYAIAQVFVIALHNDFIKIGFPVFRLFSVVALIMMIFFFFRLPGNIWPRSVKKTDGLTVPKNLFAGVLLWTAMSCLLALFGNAVAEGTPHGVSLCYLSAMICCIAVCLLWKKFGVTPFRSISVFVAMGAMGFILAIASLYAPVLGLVACVLLGAGCVCCWITPLFGIVLAKHYPSRYISPAIIGVSLITVMVHSRMLHIFRSNLTGLYIVYLVIAVGLVIIYLILEPYLIFSFKNKTPPPPPAVSETADSSETPTTKPGKTWRETLQANALEPLSDGELDIAGFIMLGYKPGDIAKETRYTLNTVKSYRKELYSKLQIHETRELFAKARKITKEQ